MQLQVSLSVDSRRCFHTSFTFNIESGQNVNHNVHEKSLVSLFFGIGAQNKWGTSLYTVATITL